MARVFGQGDCLCQVVNTCGTETSLAGYEVYDPARPTGYEEGDRVIYPENKGTLILVLEASQDVPQPVGELDRSKWVEICRKNTTDLSYLPSYTELLSRYDLYDESDEYLPGDVAIKISNCGDYACVMVGVWTTLYCVPTGEESTCKKVKKCGPGRVLVSLSSRDNDLVCVPVESSVGVGPRR